MKIYGAGLAGLLAGCAFPQATLIEGGNENQAQHKAILRFRSPAVGDAVGIPFRRVKVHKSIWVHEQHIAAPTIQIANWYSQKVVNRLSDRSIWRLETADRWIAPEDFLAQLVERCAGRIMWRTEIKTIDNKEVVISTLPMPVMTRLTHTVDCPEFVSSPIGVRRWRIVGADVFQTVYFPFPHTTLYRASIIGDILIAEYVVQNGLSGQPIQFPVEDDLDMFHAFGLQPSDGRELETSVQRYGKILPIDDQWRKNFIFNLSHMYNIFSLGRFGTWRNILLDDVLHDIGVVRELMRSSTYDRARHNAKAL